MWQWDCEAVWAWAKIDTLFGCDSGKGGLMIKVARVPSFFETKDTKSGRVNFIIS